MNILESEYKLRDVMANLAQMLRRNTELYFKRTIYQEKIKERYVGITWETFYNNILNIACNLHQIGFLKGDKMVIFSPNCIEMLELELAVMASGGISIPIFSNFKQDTAELLIKHSDAKFLSVKGATQLANINANLLLKNIFVFDNIELSAYPELNGLASFSALLKERTDKNFQLNFDAKENEICLNMYTSGTMGRPKCVQLSHQNILSQQAAMKLLWNINENDRFLSYLPWHHSFGGIFELFASLYNGAMLSLESSYGKNPELILENWKLVKPTVFFSVPKIYQSLINFTKESKEAEELFFHTGLKFIFTAAATLPEKLSAEFEKRNIPMLEGYGLTETSPCCTITDPKIKRIKGVVGKPIPGVKIRLSTENEIQVKGPNVMIGYYKNEEANKSVFTDDDWFCTGDIGEFTETGLKLVSRKDRIFKLSNGEKVNPSEMESILQSKCHYISFALVEGAGKDHPVALLFPDKNRIVNPDYEISPLEGCFCPRNLDELGKCLHGCMNDANCNIKQSGLLGTKIKAVALIDDELSIENGTLTPSMKVAPKKVLNMYKAQLEKLHESINDVTIQVYVVKLDDINSTIIHV